MQAQSSTPATVRTRDPRTGPSTQPITRPNGGARGLPPLADEVNGGGRPLGGRLELAEQLAGMSASLGGVDPRAAERLENLARAVGTEEGRLRWGEVDLRRAFNTERLAHAYAVRREGGLASPAIDRADRARNILVMLPVLLTWFALAEASQAYHRFLDKNPDQIGKPFLLLWQQGFGGESSFFAPSFSTVGIIDAAIIALIIALTFYSHGRREAREDAIAATASSFQTDLDNVLSDATIELSRERATRPAILAQSVERLADRFEHNSQELLNRLRVEHDRLESIAGRREREFADFGVFASGMRAGAEETHRLLIELRQVSSGLHTALEDLTSEVSGMDEQQRGLVNALTGLERLVGSGIQSDQAVTRQLTAAANSLAETSDKALSGAETASQAGRIATEAVRGIAELTAILARSQERVENAVADEAESNSRLADALRGSAGGVIASTKTLNEIGAGLAQLRVEFSRLSDQSAEQAATLSDLLGEQRTIAGGLVQVVRELRTVGTDTAGRQREVTDDVTALLNRLDRVTELLSNAAETIPSADGIQQAFTRALRAELGHPPDPGADSVDAWSNSGTSSRTDRAAALWPRTDRR